MRFKSFIENNKTSKEIVFSLDEYVVHLVCSNNDALLIEARLPGKLLRGPYSAVAHAENTNTKTQYHLHIYKNQNQLFAINKDGTAHDSSHGVRIPSKVGEAIQKYYPDVVIPAGNILECLTRSEQLMLLIETESMSRNDYL